MRYSEGFAFKLKPNQTNHPPPRLLLVKKKTFLTSSDPVSEGLAFFGAITGESDPSRSSCEK